MEERLIILTVMFFVSVLFVSGMPKHNFFLNDRPFYIKCASSLECGKHQCCTIGMGRFSIPTCRDMLFIGEPCRPSFEDESVSLNVTYPDGMTISLSNVYYNLCPCGPGLTCSHETGTCVDLSQDINFNYIDNLI